MAKFIFSLQNILNMKEKLEDQAKNEFSQANLRLVEAEEEHDRRKKRQMDAEDTLRETVRNLQDIQEVRSREDAVEVLKMFARQQELVVLQRRKEVEVARNKLQEAMRERKTFEKLREKAFDEFMAEESIKEQKEVDELVSYRYGTGKEE